MKKTTLVIMAAGIGSRYGAGIKQLAAVDKSGHIIMDYSIHDAIAAGFQKIVFIIRRDIEKDFREVIGNRIEAVCAKAGVEVAYCFQSLTEIPGSLPEGRSKPWGTGQAVLAAKDHIDGPFARHQRRRLLRQEHLPGYPRLSVHRSPGKCLLHGGLHSEKHPVRQRAPSPGASARWTGRASCRTL